MTEQSPSRQNNAYPTANELPLVCAEQLDPAFLAGYYVAEQRRSPEWNRTLDAWKLLEVTLADPMPVIDRQPLNDAFDKALHNQGRQRNPATETYRFDVTGRAALPLFIARHDGGREPRVEERMETYGILGDELEYILDYSESQVAHKPDYGALSEFIGFGMFVRRGSTGILFPSSPREALGHDTENNHDGYQWLPSGEKIPVELKHVKRKSPSGGISSNISVLRIGHKIQEAIGDRPIDLRKHNMAQVEQDTVRVARLLIEESRGKLLPIEDLELLDTLGDLLCHKIDQDQLIVRTKGPEEVDLDF
ncbi:MAG: hypothetical protein ABWX94_00840 [Candidatus Saccharimonadales bacterium]